MPCAAIGQIADIMASVGGGLDLESVLVREWEDAFASTFGEGTPGVVIIYHCHLLPVWTFIMRN